MNESTKESPWTLDDDVNDYLATLELPPEDVTKKYMEQRAIIEAQVPKPGETAPDFTLEKLTPDGERSGETLSLSDFRGSNLALLFGNYTCPVYRGQLQRYKDIYAECKDRIAFLIVYVREEHPEDGWQLGINHSQSCVYYQPTTADERALVAADLIRDHGIEIPLVIDDLDDSVCNRYGGLPERLYVIDKHGIVCHASPPGPFHMDAVDAWCEAVRATAE